MNEQETKTFETDWAFRTWAGSCNFCTRNDYDKVFVIRSADEARRLSIKLCPTCKRELGETLREGE